MTPQNVYRPCLHVRVSVCLLIPQVKVRPSTPSVSRQFVISKNLFEFGPVLAGRDPTGYQDNKYPDHTARLRITNNGLFPARVELGLQSAVSSTPRDGKKAAPPAGAKGDKGKGGAGEGPFILSHTELDLAIDETQEITLYAFPGQVRTGQDRTRRGVSASDYAALKHALDLPMRDESVSP